MSRIAYQNTPLAREKIRQGIFVFRGGGGSVTAVSVLAVVAYQMYRHS
jgi:hypothetical protein